MKPEIADLPGKAPDYIWEYRLLDLTKDELIRIIGWQDFQQKETAEAGLRHRAILSGC